MTAPYKLTPMHNWHLRHGARMTEASGWRRVVTYGNPQAELTTTCSLVGICDVTPMTKVDVQGTQTGQFIERFLGPTVPEPGRSVFAKRISPPAHIVRLTSERFLLFGDSEDRIPLINLLMETAHAGCVHVTDMTSAYAALLLVGPFAPELMRNVSTARLHPAQFVNNACTQTTVARVWCLILRHDFGRLRGFVLLVARDYGEYVWDTLISAGHDFRIQPFGTDVEQALERMEEIDVATV